MGKKITIIASAVFVLLVIWIAISITTMGAPLGLRDAFSHAVPKGDAAAVRALTIDSEAPRIWDTLRSGQIDKAEKIVTRGLSWSVPWFGQATGYLDLTAENSSGLSVPFRLELVRGGMFIPSAWRISAVVLDTKK